MLALPKMRAQPRQEDAEPERLCHIVIGACIEAGHRVGLAVGRGQHDDRRADPAAAHPAAQFAAVHIGEPDIEENRVEPLAPRRGERLHRSVALDGGKLAVLLQLLGQRMAQCRVVIDDQDLAKTAHTLSLPCCPPIPPIAGRIIALFARLAESIPVCGPGLRPNYPFSDGRAPARRAGGVAGMRRNGWHTARQCL